MEQTETPEQLELRRKATGIKDKVCLDSMVSIKVSSCLAATCKCNNLKDICWLLVSNLAIFVPLCLLYNFKNT